MVCITNYHHKRSLPHRQKYSHDTFNPDEAACRCLLDQPFDLKELWLKASEHLFLMDQCGWHASKEVWGDILLPADSLLVLL